MKTRVLHAQNEFWSARARWVYRDGIWSAVIMDEQLRFLKGLDPASAKIELIKLGCRWIWTKVEDLPAPQVT